MVEHGSYYTKFSIIILSISGQVQNYGNIANKNYFHFANTYRGHCIQMGNIRWYKNELNINFRSNKWCFGFWSSDSDATKMC